MNLTPKPRKKNSTAPVHNDPSAGWERLEQATVHGRHLTPGTEVSITGERGRYKFLWSVTTPSGAHWLEFVGGPNGTRAFRSFKPERVKTVHRLQKLRPSDS